MEYISDIYYLWGGEQKFLDKVNMQKTKINLKEKL